MPQPEGLITKSAAFDQGLFDFFLSKRREPSWITERRRAAFGRFRRLSLPDRSVEEWRRIDLRAFSFDKFAPAFSEMLKSCGPDNVSCEEAVAVSSLVPIRGIVELCPPTAASYLDGSIELSGFFVQVGGVLRRALLRRELNDKGVLLLTLEAAARNKPELVKRYLGKVLSDWDRDKFSAGQEAFWSGGPCFFVPENVRVEAPFYLLVDAGECGVDFSRALIVLARGSRASIWLELRGEAREGPSLSSGKIEVLLEPGARLELVEIQNLSGRVWSFSRQRALLEEHAQLMWLTTTLGSRLAKTDQEVILAGDGAGAEVRGLVCTDGREHVSLHTRQEHESPNTRSNLLCKGTLQGESEFVWRGMIRVWHGALKTDAYQRNDNLLLSPAARARCIPGLEIEADDVKCSHGATVGRVDEDQVFYCTTRGLSREDAVRLIVQGFYSTILDDLPSPVAAGIDAILTERLKLGRAASG